MKIFRNKILMKIIVSICIVLTIMNCGTPYKVRADWEGLLITPITKLLTSICDGIMGILHKTIQYQDISMVELSGKEDWWEKHGEKALAAIVTVLVIAIAAIGIVATGGAAIAAGTAMVKVIASTALAVGAIEIATFSVFGAGVATLTGQFVAERAGEAWFSQGTLYLPAFTLTPETIFSNKLPLFDVNFFNPGEYMVDVIERVPSLQDGQFTIKPTTGMAYDLNQLLKGANGGIEIWNWGGTSEGQTAKQIYELWNNNGNTADFINSLFTEDEINAGNLSEEAIKAKAQEKLNQKGIKEFISIANQLVEAAQPGGSHAASSAWTTPAQYSIDNMINTRVAISGEYNGDSIDGNYRIHRYRYTLIIGSTSGESKDVGSKKLYTGVEFTHEIKEPIVLEAGANVCYHRTSNETPWQEASGNRSFNEKSWTETVTVTPAHNQIIQVRKESTAEKLSGVISKWYFILRNFALLALMVILVYIGIRIVLGSTAGAKAKYKERLMDWLVAMCLIFVMHYIMVFSVELIGKITELVNSVKDFDGTAVSIPLSSNHLKNLQKMEEGQTEADVAYRDDYSALLSFGTIVDSNSSTGKDLMWTTDIMGKMRIMSQTTEEGTARWVGYALCYMVLVIYTIFFTWTYVKRVLYMAFLTLIAPMVAMTYPIDKMNDGKAQAFNTWLKEYIFNLLIQPMHLLLYTILVTTAYKLAVTNPIYAVVAIGFLTPAEKLVRSFFGFTKAKTAGALGGAAGAALAFTGMQSMMKFAKGKGSSKDAKGDKDTAKIKFASREGVNEKETVAKSVEEKSKIKKAKPESTPTPEAGASQQTETGVKVRQQATPTTQTPGTGKQDTSTPEAGKSTPPPPGVGKTPTPKSGEKSKPADDKKAEEKKKAGKGKRIVRAVTGAGAQYGRQLQRKLVNRVNKARPIRAMARGVTGLAGATALGMTGLALGIASGDASKAFQYTTAGVAGGYAVGKNIGGNTVDALSVNTEKIQEEMRMTYMGEDYKDFKFEESVNKMSHDEGNINKVRKLTGLSYNDSQEMLGTVGRKCMQSGIDNVEDMAAVYQMGQQGYTTDQAIAALKFNRYLPSDLNSMGKEDREDHIAQWASEYEEAGYENPTDLAEESMKLAETINKIKSDMKKADV